ncbi:MAG: ABC transporter ATP-binding protein [Clostridiales bacterium]|nr:ABC transporter ATP-binding protein [Clostridiales bacterium]
MYGPRGGPRPLQEEKPKEPRPKNFEELIEYIVRVWGGFFKRLFYIYSLVWETRKWIFFALLGFAIINGFTPVIGAYIGKLIIDVITNVIAEKPPDGLMMVIPYLILNFGYIFLTSLISSVNGIVNRIASELVTNHIKLKICNKAKEVDLRSFDMPEFYEKLENANREAGGRPMQILNSTLSIASTLISAVSFVVILWAVSPIAPLIVVILSIPSAVVNFKYRKKNVWYMRWHSKERRQMQYYSDLIVNKDMVKEVKLFNLADGFLEKYKQAFDKYFGGMKKLIFQENAIHMGISIFSVAGMCFLYILVVKGVINGEDFSIGDYTYFTSALSNISGSFSSLIGTTVGIYEGTLFIDNMIMFMNEERTVASILPEPAHVEKHVEHELRLENVSFRYPGMTYDVLHDINLTIKSGESIVLVGLNGAGKTTLIKLLTRLYDPTGGTIYLDGRDIREYDTEELYSLFGIIFQDFGRYAVSVRENIAFGDVSAPVDEQRIKKAAKESNADSFIDKFEEGYDAQLMRFFELTGKELSGGQWQKLAVARAFYGDSDILILDEPTASLDAIAEQEIFNQFEQLRQGKLTVFVSHRLSSAVRASQIVVLSDGTILEKGTHNELMKKGGVYHDLFITQAERYIASVDGEEEEAPELPAGRPPFGGKPPFDGKPPFGERPPFDGKMQKPQGK